MDKIIDPNICGWDTASFLIISNNVFGSFIYYSHLFPAISILLIGIAAIYFNPRGITNRILFLIAIIFTCWSLFDLVLWATERTDYTMFFWSALVPLELTLYILAFYLAHSFLYAKLPDWRFDLLAVFLFLPVTLFGHTNLALTAFDFTNCWREAVEGPLITLYLYNVEVFLTFLILAVGTHAIITSSKEVRVQKILFVTAILSFLFTFSAGNILGSLETDWELGQFGLFGVPIMSGFLLYLIVKYQALKMRFIAPEVLVGTLFVLNLSLLFLRTIENIRIVALLTTLVSIVLGFVLIRSVRKEISQRKQIELLASQLETANSRLKELDKLKSEFVSIASHQMRSPLTSMRGYASMLLDGSYGSIPEKAKEAVQRIADSSGFMAKMVENYLNVSRIESGNMKYELSDFNLKLEVEKVVDDKRQEAIKKGLLLTFKSSLSGQGIVHADIGKTLEIVHNLLNNALKYTVKGTVDVTVHDDPKKKKIYVDIHDSGIGMNKEDIAKLFGKFERAHNANTVNITGTGLGLYVARTMALAMKGEITASSTGPDQGSTFRFELPMMM